MTALLNHRPLCVLIGADQILPTLSFRGELEQPLIQNFWRQLPATSPRERLIWLEHSAET